MTFFPDDVESLPEGAVTDGTRVTQDLEDAADFVVVGSGAAGATSALYLAEAGYSVIILEDGPWIKTRDFGVDVFFGDEFCEDVIVGFPKKIGQLQFIKK